MEQMHKHTDLFLTHTWRTDLHNRDNHARVRIINEELNRLGFATWFDENKITGDIKAKMAEGVDFTKCVMVFVTEEYLKKIDSPGDDDNCKYEFDRALKQKTEKNILCITMEKKLDNPSDWFGKLKQTLGGCLCVRMSGNLDDKNYLKQQLKEVVEQLKSKGVVPSQIKNKCEDCTITNKSGEQQPLFADGNACTFCGENLKKTTDPKNYCVVCNVHSNGSFCHICKVHLLNKNQCISELEEQLLKLISLQLNVDLKEYHVEDFKVEIEKMKKELVDILAKRQEVKTSGFKLRINEKEYNNKVEHLQQKMGGILNNTTYLDATKETVIQTIEPYNKDLSQLKKSLRSLEDRRKNFDQRANELSRAKDELQQLQKQVEEFAKSAVVGEKHLHDKSCSCDDCSLERELTSKIITDGTRQCIEKFIIENDIDKLRTAINLKSEIIELKDHNELNLLLSLTVQHGTMEMLQMLLENNICIDTEKMLNLVEIDKDNNLLRKIISENKVKELLKIIELQNDIVNARTKDGLNLWLFFSVQFGTLEMFNRLVEMGLEADTVNTRNETLLHYVKNTDIAKVLCINYGDALLPVKDEDGFTPFMKAYREKNSAVAETISPFVIVDQEINCCIMLLLENRGFKYIEELIKEDDTTTIATLLTLKPDVVDMKNKVKKTPFFLCCESGSTEILKLLIEHGSDANKCDVYGYSALTIAVWYNTTEWCEEVVEYLCTTHPQLLTMEDKYGRSVFYWAASFNREDLVPILLKHSPPPKYLKVRSSNGETPIDLAKRKGFEPIAHMYENYIEYCNCHQQNERD